VRKIVADASRDFCGEAGLADTTGADEGDNSLRSKAITQQLRRVVPTDEARIAGRKVGGRPLKRQDLLADNAAICCTGLPNTPAAKQPITSPGCCLQHPPIRAERPANCCDVNLQGILFDGNPRPDMRQKSVFRNQLPGGFREFFNDFERAAANRSGSSAETEFPPTRVDLP
jgi:hypothetical protein